MDFDLSSDQRALVESVEKFARGTYTKLQRPSSEAPVEGYSVAFWRQMADLGVAGLSISEEYGGLGLSIVETLLVAEVLGQVLSPEPFVSAAVVAPRLLEMCDTPAVRETKLHAISSGEMRIAPAFYETVAAYDLNKISTAVGNVEGKLQIRGKKELVVDGRGATHFAVTASVGERGLGVFLVAADAPGVTVLPVRGLDGRWLARVTFEGAPVEENAPLFELDASLEMIERALDFGNLALCAEALGLMNKMLSLTAGYLETRKQFGKPIGSFQALQHRFADMVVAAEQSRSVTLMAASALLHGDSKAAASDVSAAKSAICRHGRAVLEGAVQLHGGIGITDEYELSGYVRRMLAIEKTWGDRRYHESRFERMRDS